MTTTCNSSNLQITSSLIKFANGNTGNAIDIGYYGQYTNAGTKYAALFKDATDGVWKLVSGLTVEPSGNVVDLTNAIYDPFRMDNITLSNGTVSAPSINFGDAASGLYRSALNNIDVSINGNQIINISSSGLSLQNNKILNLADGITSTDASAIGQIWKLVASSVNPTAALSFTISGLAGSTDEVYKIIYKIMKPTSNGHLSIQFNGDTGANYIYIHLFCLLVQVQPQVILEEV